MLCLCCAAFIFTNSLLGGSDSNKVSSGVAEAVEPVARPIFEDVSGNALDDALYHKLIRKSAHFIEFFTLGFLLLLLTRELSGRVFTGLIFMPLFAALLIAVTDEFIQSFTGRTSMVEDVLLDFSGAVAGMAVAALLYALVRACVKARAKRRGAK